MSIFAAANNLTLFFCLRRMFLVSLEHLVYLVLNMNLFEIVRNQKSSMIRLPLNKNATIYSSTVRCNFVLKTISD